MDPLLRRPTGYRERPVVLSFHARCCHVASSLSVLWAAIASRNDGNVNDPPDRAGAPDHGGAAARFGAVDAVGPDVGVDGTILIPGEENALNSSRF